MGASIGHNKTAALPPISKPCPLPIRLGPRRLDCVEPFSEPKTEARLGKSSTVSCRTLPSPASPKRTRSAPTQWEGASLERQERAGRMEERSGLGWRFPATVTCSVFLFSTQILELS